MTTIGDEADLFADDVPQKGEETFGDLENHLGDLQQVAEPNGLRICKDKTKKLSFHWGGEELQGGKGPPQWSVTKSN